LDWNIHLKYWRVQETLYYCCSDESYSILTDS
jgi:hypothetical protein